MRGYSRLVSKDCSGGPAGCNLKRLQPRLWKQEGHLIETARLAILDKEEGWLDQWVLNWKLQRKWEADGHRTVAWEVPSQLT